MMTIRILHVVTSMDPGGIETMIMNIYRNINRDKVQFDFLVHRKHKGYFEDEIINLGGRIFRTIPIRPLSIHNYLLNIKKFFKENKYKIIHSHISVYSFFVLMEAKKQDVPFRIAHSHESHKSIREHRLLRRPIIFFLKLIINKPTTHRFACSTEAGYWLFGSNKSFTVINNAIDVNKYRFSLTIRNKKREELKLNKELLIGHVGNFSKAKNYPFILDVFSKILEKNSNSKLILIGNYKNNKDIYNEVEKLGIKDSVILTGVRSDIPDLLQSMDLFLFPSINEGLPVTLIEAQASGVPILASKTITEEVKLSDSIEFISLNKSSHYWAERALLKYRNTNLQSRIAQFEKVRISGFDVSESSNELQKFYLSLH